ncbi:MAG: acetyl-CoA carboxylase biotin carboxyl carrier protein [Armatimonadota bacterium]
MSDTIEVKDVEEVLALMEQWDVAEMHLSVGESTLDLVRDIPAAAPASAPGIAAAVAGMESAAEALDFVTVTATVVGMFHLARRGFPQGAPQPGDHVQAGQIIGSIELMHLPTDIISPVSGIIEAILVDEGTGVEYGQPLMAIRPFEEASEDEAGMLPPPAR